MNFSLKIFSLSIVLPFFSVNAKAQDWTKNIPQKADVNFYDVQKAFNDYWADKTAGPFETDNKEEGGYQQFRRWENFMKPRVYPSGVFNSGALMEEYQKYKNKFRVPGALKSLPNWTSLGPNSIPGGYAGATGRINVLTFDPSNSSNLWIGTPDGGLWKSTNGGTSWTSNTDLLPNISIADIAIDPVQPANMYLATGDGYGYGPYGNFWGGTYSAGVLKSTDGGLTWNTTGLSYIQSQGTIIQRLLVSPSNPQILLAGASNGIWRSADGGTTWSNVHAGHFYDMEWNTANSSIVYASSAVDIYKSTDAGLTWNPLNSGIQAQNQKLMLAVTAANSQVIYGFTALGELYKSNNGGSSFQYQGPADAGYGFYNTVITASPADENILFTQGFDVSESMDGGLNWFPVSDWTSWPANTFVHPDGHDLKFLPGNPNTLFACNDGGIYKSADGGQSWSDISNGLAIAQFYRLGCSQTNPGFILSGQQDVGSVRINSGSYDMVSDPGDGMEQLIDYTDPTIFYSSVEYGSIAKTEDGGNSFFDISPLTTGDWNTPIVMDSHNPQILYGAYDQVLQSVDGGLNWMPISNLQAGTTLSSLALAPSDANTIYTSTLTSIYSTTDGGNSWNDITGIIPTNGITGIAVSNVNAQTLWLSLSGYSTGKKVYKSIDGGSSWTNVSGTLPNIPVNCILYENNSNDAIYIGTDFGVFYRDNTLNDWVSFNNGLPNVIVNELEIQYGASKLRAATYGRGLWETDITMSPAGIKEKSLENSVMVYPNPNTGNFTVKWLDNLNAKIEVFTIVGEKVYETTVKSTMTQNSINIDISKQSPGIYFVKMETDQGCFNKKITLTK